MNEIISDLRNNKKLILTTLDYKPEGFEIDYSMYITARSISSYNNSFEYLAKDLEKHYNKPASVILIKILPVKAGSSTLSQIIN